MYGRGRKPVGLVSFFLASRSLNFGSTNISTVRIVLLYVVTHLAKLLLLTDSLIHLFVDGYDICDKTALQYRESKVK